jgi:4-hydroxybenzoate polyprenyltransferase
VNRWWTYQRERFPVFAFATFIAAVCVGVLAFSARARGVEGPSLPAFVVAFSCTFLIFLQLRVADEFKDYADDAAARPYRPVQRGLVRLSELRVVAVAALVVQVTLAAWLDVRLLAPLLLMLAYLALMTREFFAPRWLRSHATVYLLSHQVILPLVYLFISACDWLPGSGGPGRGLAWILGLGYFSGMVVEIGRKIRSPGDEEKGVETYSVLWGRRGAVAAWLSVAFLSGAFATRAAAEIGFARPVAGVAGALFIVLAATALRFLGHPAPGAGKKIDAASGLWTVLVHGALGAALFR